MKDWESGELVDGGSPGSSVCLGWQFGGVSAKALLRVSCVVVVLLLDSAGF